ncbi:hypothetical protein O3M35_000536 [Rhynocoris fuscipes]
MLASSVQITKEQYASLIVPKIGRINVDKITLDNGFMSVDLINYGSTITAIRLPDRELKVNDIVLGFDNIDGYLSDKNPYFGATIGRVCNRISNGSFVINDVKYYLSRNIGENTLHGGVSGFDKKIWKTEITNTNAVVMSYISPHLEEGFPGQLETQVRYVLTDNNYLVIKFTATTNEETPVNLTNHSYFNLAGHDSGAEGLYEHELMINANQYTELDPDTLIPTGKFIDVNETPFDFREFKNVGKAIESTEGAGFDINFCVRGEDLRTIARLQHEPSGRSLQVFANKPGVQLYTSNYVNGIEGKNGAIYDKHAALCLETQNYPNAINIKNFPSSLLCPREVYEHILIYKFRVEDQTVSEEEEEEEDDDDKTKKDKRKKDKKKQ